MFSCINLLAPNIGSCAGFVTRNWGCGVFYCSVPPLQPRRQTEYKIQPAGVCHCCDSLATCYCWKQGQFGGNQVGGGRSTVFSWPGRVVFVSAVSGECSATWYDPGTRVDLIRLTWDRARQVIIALPLQPLQPQPTTDNQTDQLTTNGRRWKLVTVTTDDIYDN